MSDESPISILLDISGNPIGSIDNDGYNRLQVQTELSSGNPLSVILTDGENAIGTGSNPLRINPTGTTTQPISATSLPLPSGAATETTLETLLTTSAFDARINSLGQKNMAGSTPVVLASDQAVIPISDNNGSLTVDGYINSIQSGNWVVNPGNTPNTTPWLTSLSAGGNTATITNSNALKVDASGTTQPISASSLPLPTGAATESTLSGVLTTSAFDTRINTLGQKTSSGSTPVVLASDQSVIPINDNGGSLTVDGTVGATQSGSWSVSLSQGGNTATISAGGALKTDSSGTTQPVSGTITANIGTTNGLALDATVAKLTLAQGTSTSGSTNILSGAAASTSSPTYTNGTINPLSLTTAGALRTDSSATTQPVSQSGTWTVQPGNTANTTPWLATISQGGNVANVSASNALKVDNSAVVQPVSGTITANAGTGSFAVVQATASNLNATIVGTTAAGSGASTGLITIQGNASGTPVPVSGTLTASNPSVASTAASPPTSATYIGGSVSTSSPSYTSGQLNALSLTTSGALRTDSSGTTQPISASSLPLPTGAATDSTLSGVLTTTDFNARVNTLGQKTSANSTPVVLASDQSSFSISANQNGTWNVNADAYATSALPTYTNNTFQPLSLGTSGLLRTDGSNVVQPVSGTITANVGTTNGLALDATLTGGSQQSKITDGTNIATVKPSSTAALTTDKALVVAISPNNTVPVSGTFWQSVQPVSQSGTWTLQPGNTANTTPWLTTINQGGNSASVTASNALKVDGSATTQPVSGTGSFTVAQSTASNLNATIVGTTNAGSGATTGLITVQGNASGTPIPVSGTFTANTDGYVTTTSPTYTNNTFQALSLTTSGALRTDASATTQPISGTITANAGTGSFTVVQTTASNLNANVSGTVSANQSGTWTVQPGNTANTTPWLSTINQGGNSAIVTASNALKVDNSGITQPVSGTITANAGTGSFTVAQGTASNLNATIVGTTAAGSGASSGLITIQGNASGTPVPITGTISATNPSVSSTGATPPTSATYIGGSVSTSAPSYTNGQMSPLSLGTTGLLRVDGSGATQPVSGTGNFTVVQTTAANLNATVTGTVASTQSGTWTVQPGNTANTTPWLSTISQGGNSAAVTASNALKVDASATTQPVSGTITANIGTSGSLALDTSVNGILLAQGSTTSGQKGTLIQGSVSTSSPTYTTAQTSPLSLTTSGALRTDASATTQPISGTITANAGTGNFNVIQSTASSLNATIVGTTAAGSGASSGLITIQGNASGTPVPITGSISATNPSVSTINSTTPTSGTYIGGAVSTNAPTYTSGQLSGLSLTTAGSLRVDGYNGTFTVSQGTASNLKTQTASEGTVAGTTGTIASLTGGATTTSAPTYTTGQMNPLSLTTAGALRVDNSGITQTVAQATASNLNATVIGNTSAGSGASTGLITIQGNASGTPVPITGSISATNPSVGTINSTAPTSGTYIGGSVATSAPTYTSGQMSALSLTTTGALRVDTSTSAAPGPVYLTTPSGFGSSIFATSFPAGFLRTSDEPHQVLYDPFEGALDTNNWNSPTSSGGGVAPSISSGNMTLGSGTTSLGYAFLQSVVSFRLPIPGWLGISSVIKIENPVSTNAYRFWGQGTVPGSPTASSSSIAGNSLTNAVGWEIGTDGKLLAVVWSAGTRTIVQDLSTSGNSKQPTDANFHRYIVYVRTDKIYWYIDSLDVFVASANFTSPQVQTLPELFLAISSVIPPTSSVNLVSAGTAVWDSAKNATQISDGYYPSRKATVKPAGVAATTSDTALVVALSPNNSVVANADGYVSSSSPTYSAGTFQSVSLTTSGALRTDASATTQPVSGTITANAGSGTFGISGAVSQSGTWTVQPGNTANTTPWLTTISQGGNSATITGSNALKVDASATTQPISGTITANIGTTNGLALDASIAKLTITQGSALGSNTQALVGGSVSTSSPSYTSGNINPFSLTTSGALRIDGSGATQPVSGTIAATQSGTWTVQPGNTANTTPWLSKIGDGTNNASIKASATAPSSTDPALVVAISPNTASALNQSLTLSSTTSNVAISTLGMNSVGLNITGTWSASIACEGTVDGTNWFAINAYNTSTNSYGQIFSINVAGWTIPCAGYAQVRMRCSTTGTGTAVISLISSLGLQNVNISTIASGSNTIGSVNQGNSSSLNPWLMQIGNGTNNASIKAASTAALTTDPALVVSLSPNTPAKLYDGTNTATIKAASTASVATDTALVTSQSINSPYVASFKSNTLNATSTQTGAAVWTPSSGKKIALTSIIIGTYGTTSARLILWFGSSSDTTYTAGTDQIVLAATFTPSSTATPGLVFTPAIPVFCANSDYILRCTTSAGLSFDLTSQGYEF